LLVPQIGFLFGVQVLLIWTRLDGGWLGLIWSHLLFVLPYVFLALADPYRSLDPRYERSALALGKSPWLVWTRIKLMLLLRPLLVALAVGFAVSVGQYLPTLFAGGGRFATLTTEALGLSAGGDRRLIGQLALTLAALPLLGFGLALALPAWRFRQRRAMRVGT
jgi:putative thiamine transport system permease protein